MLKFINTLANLCLLFISAMLLQSCGVDNEITPTLRVGYAIEKPYAYFDENAELTGYAIESTKALAEKLGYSDITWIQIQFPSLIDSLISKRVDIVSAGMFITPERRKLIDFSIPFAKVDSVFLVSSAGISIITRQDNVTRQLSVAVIEGSVEAQILEKTNLPGIEILNTPDSFTATASIYKGIADAIFLSKPSLLMIQADMPGDYQIVPANTILASTTTNEIGYGFHKKNDHLRLLWNEAAKTWITSNQHQKLLTDYGLQTVKAP